MVVGNFIILCVFCTLIWIVVFPLFIYWRIESMHRSIRYLREDLETQDLELKQLREKLINALTASGQTNEWDF